MTLNLLTRLISILEVMRRVINMRRRRGGIFSNIIYILGALMFIGIFLAVLAQFGGDLGAMFQWILDFAWGIITSVRDAVSGWETFQRLF